MTKEEFESLGWKYDDCWNNRMMYSLSDNSNFVIFEHYGWGIMDPYRKDFALIYCNMTDNMIRTFTALAKKLDMITNNPKEYSLYDYIQAEAMMKDFVKKMKDRG